jgi:hypothetical protein
LSFGVLLAEPLAGHGLEALGLLVRVVRGSAPSATLRARLVALLASALQRNIRVGAE